MNWVGGSRNRIIFKQERRKQKEFFERKKLKSKLKLLNSTSPKSSSFSLDLLNLYVVNQIASKKEITNTKAVHVDMSRGTTFPVGRHNVELPMSPTTVPSKICLEDCEINVQPKQESNNMKTRVLTGKIKDIPFAPFSKTGGVSGDLWNHLQNTEQSSGKVGDQIQLRNMSEYTNR
ncbi:hypothetical protein FKM82_012788 [Ascaphus truei]